MEDKRSEVTTTDRRRHCPISRGPVTWSFLPPRGYMARVRLRVAVTFVLTAACRSAPAPAPVAPGPPSSVQIHTGTLANCGDRVACARTGKPLFIIDGVMLDSTRFPLADTTSDASKRFAPLDPSEIDSIAVAKGDSAVRKYGPAAKNGVVLIWTKRAAKGASPH